jgi:hypothetical protein
MAAVVPSSTSPQDVATRFLPAWLNSLGAPVQRFCTQSAKPRQYRFEKKSACRRLPALPNFEPAKSNRSLIKMTGLRATLRRGTIENLASAKISMASAPELGEPWVTALISA